MAINKVAHEGKFYSYFGKLKTWRNYATKNNIPFDCEKCKKVHAHKTVLSENGSHICWYCWIRKQEETINVVQKPQEIIKVKHVKTIDKPIIKSSPKQVVNKNVIVPHKPVKALPQISKKPISESKNQTNALVPMSRNTTPETQERLISSDNYYDNVKQCFYEVIESKNNNGYNSKKGQ